ncbi:hypothetical protein GOP47_0004210, partial [Adiantum capillus-veneris]
MASLSPTRWPPWSLCARASPISLQSLHGHPRCLRHCSYTIRASANGASNMRVSEREQKKSQEVEMGVAGKNELKAGNENSDGGVVVDADDTDRELCNVPSCPVPEFSSSYSSISLLSPYKFSSECSYRPLLVYAPGMDCTGQGIIRQLPYLVDAGYDIRCIYIPTTDRSSWAQLVQSLIPMLREELQGRKERHVTLLGESFGGPLALRLVKEAPDLFSRLVLVNPAINLQQVNPLVSFCSRSGLLAFFPDFLYKTAQDILLPLMVNWNRVRWSDYGDIFSPVDLVPAPCASWRLSLLNDNTDLDDTSLNSIHVPTLLLASSEDHILSSVQETGRLNRLLSYSKRIILPGSGHTALLEDDFNLAKILERHGFCATASAQTRLSAEAGVPASPFKDSEKTEVKDEYLDEMGRLLQPWRFLTSPLVSGEENLPSPESKRPILFVGNHTMFGVYDTPLLFHELFLRGFRCRGLAHPGHWRTFVGPLFERYGHVKATKRAAYKLLRAKEHVLLFPGGAREVCKKKNEEYKLIWKPTADFVRMATRFNAIIVPFGSLGGDDAYKILLDADDIMGSPFAPLLTDVYNRIGISLDTIYPVTAFPGTNIPSLVGIPNIERIYFHFGEPVDTASFNGSQHGNKFDEMYSLVKSRVEDSINWLKTVRSSDK